MSISDPIILPYNRLSTGLWADNNSHLFIMPHSCNQEIFQTQDIKATAITKTKMFCFRHDSLEKIGQNPLAKNIWQSILISGLSSAIETSTDQQLSMGTAEDMTKPSSIFAPLETHEMPKPCLSGSNSAIKGFMGFFNNITGIIQSKASHCHGYICLGFAK